MLNGMTPKKSWKERIGWSSLTPQQEAARLQITQWVHNKVSIQDPDFGSTGTVKVSEITCTDAVCPGTETVILILSKGKDTRALKVLMPMLDVRESDIDKALNNATT
jgi:hypothetical protein